MVVLDHVDFREAFGECVKVLRVGGMLVGKRVLNTTSSEKNFVIITMPSGTFTYLIACFVLEYEIFKVAFMSIPYH